MSHDTLEALRSQLAEAEAQRDRWFEQSKADAIALAGVRERRARERAHILLEMLSGPDQCGTGTGHDPMCNAVTASELRHAERIAELEAEVARLTSKVVEFEAVALDKLKAATPVYCKNCPFSKHVHWMQDGKLITPSCPGFEPMELPQEGAH